MNLAPVELSEVTHDRKPQAEAGDVLIGSHTTREHGLTDRFVQARAVVIDADP